MDCCIVGVTESNHSQIRRESKAGRFRRATDAEDGSGWHHQAVTV